MIEEEVNNEEEYDDIMGQERELPLDTELIRWYLQQRSHMHLSSDRHGEYTAEIWSRLGNNMRETMDFLEECDDDELDALGDVIDDLIYDFKREQSEEKYNEFIEFLKELADIHPHSELKEDLEYTLKAIKEDEEEEADNKDDLG